MPRLLLPALVAASVAGITLCLLTGEVSLGNLDFEAGQGILAVRARAHPDSVCFSDYVLLADGPFRWCLPDDSFAPPTLRAFHFHRHDDHCYLAVALAPPTILTTLATAYTLFTRILHRPIPPHLCPSCRYDLSSTPPTNPCPECGQTRV